MVEKDLQGKMMVAFVGVRNGILGILLNLKSKIILLLTSHTLCC